VPCSTASPIARWPCAARSPADARRPPEAPVARPFLRSLSRPREASAFSGECSSTARRTRGTRALGRQVQDSLVIHRSSTGQPLFVPGAPQLSPASSQRDPQDRPQPSARLRAALRPGLPEPGRGSADGHLIARTEVTLRVCREPAARLTLMSTHKHDLSRQVAARNRGRTRMRAAAVSATAASLIAAGGIAYSLPGAAAASSSQTAARGAQSAKSSGSSSSGSSASKSSSSGTSGSSGSLSTPAASPTASSGSGQATSGGS